MAKKKEDNPEMEVENETAVVVADLESPLEDAKQRAADAEIKLANHLESEKKPEKKVSKLPHFTFAKGTQLFLGYQQFTLTEDSTIYSDSFVTEQNVVGMLTVSGSNNIEVNRANLKSNYDGNGALIEE